jgi:hypothetical protein
MMSKKKKKPPHKTLDTSLPIFQIKITLEDIEPPIWRRIQTHDCSLTELHEIIQDCVGWEGDHLFAFEIGGKRYSDQGREGDMYGFRDSGSMRLSRLIGQGESCFDYEYDFGDSWRHQIDIEETLPIEENVRYPRCLDGQRACPPEDCGGIYGYYDCLEALKNPDDEENEERLEWLGDDFDPEKFSVDAVNKKLLRLRAWLGRKPRSSIQKALFSVGDRVRAKRGVIHSQYPDIPLGGWVGTVQNIAWLIPISYQVEWTEETLAAAHPVYRKRCWRDEERPDVYWLDEGQIELDSAETPIEMEQPTNLIVRPLSADNQNDRIRMVFGLTGDDPLPAPGEETQRQYLDYLKAHLTFPFDAEDWSDEAINSKEEKRVEVVGFASMSPEDLEGEDGLICEVRGDAGTERLALESMDLNDDNPNYQCVEDYKNWLWIEGNPFCDDYYDEEFSDDEADEEEDEDWDEDAEDDEEYEDDDDNDDGEDIGSLRIDKVHNEYVPPQPIHRDSPPVGRNDPCPCGSGKKFKKCCLKRQDSELF